MFCLAAGSSFGPSDRRFSDPGKPRETVRASDPEQTDEQMWKRDFDPEAIWGKTGGIESMTLCPHRGLLLHVLAQLALVDIHVCLSLHARA